MTGQPNNLDLPTVSSNSPPAGRLPAEAFDVHMHLCREDHLDPVPTIFGPPEPDDTSKSDRELDLASWRRHVDAQLPGVAIRGAVATPFPTRDGDLEAANRYVAGQVADRDGYAMTMLVSPYSSRAGVEEFIEANRVSGFKPYHCYASGDETFEADIGAFLPEWVWKLADTRGLLILLHLVKAGALADADNQRYLVDHCIRYPGAKLLLAHAARGFNAANTVSGIASLRGLENVWFDTAAICESEPLAAILSEFGPKRLLWGSDYPVSVKRGRAVSVGTGFAWVTTDDFDWSSPAFFGQPDPVGIESIRAALDACDRLGLSRDDLADIFSRNAVRLLGFDTGRAADDSATAGGSSTAEAPGRAASAPGRGSETQRLYERAKRLIPGGVQLLSKQPEQFAPGRWPAYFSEARGCEVWDLDGRHFYDLSIHGIGASALGFGDPDVTRAVRRRLELGSFSTQSAAEEVTLAETLCDIHPWAEQVRFARTGGEIMSVAVRIARATTDRSEVAVCGYHGWHDWYLAANLGEEDALRGLLLPGLEPLGVPRELRGTNHTFEHGDRDAFDAIMDERGKRLAAVVMEPCRHADPAPGFLEHIRRRTRETGTLLIFDEITIGWRVVLGGSHLRFGVNPDLAAFAKALGNGHPMAAVIGTSEAMEGAAVSFVSSTYWTEGIGPAAALATIEKMRHIDLPGHCARIGTKVQDGWRRLAGSHRLPIQVPEHYPALSHFSFEHERAQALKTLFVQEMLKRGFLATNALYLSYAHTDAITDRYLEACDEVFGAIAVALRSDSIDERLEGPEAHAGFRRLL